MSDSVAASPIHARDLAARIDALPASAGLWRFIILLSLGGFFELYDLFQTGYISTGLIADGIFHTRRAGRLRRLGPGGLRLRHLSWSVRRRQPAEPVRRSLRPPRHLHVRPDLVWRLLAAAGVSTAGGWVIFLRFLVGVGLGMELVTIDTYLTGGCPRICALGLSPSRSSCSSCRCRRWR